MKTDFSLERFNRLFRLEMKRDSRTNLMWLAVIFGLFILLAVQLTAFREYNYADKNSEMYSWYFNDYTADVMLVFFWIGLFLGGCFSASMMMHPIRDKESAIPSLILPASQLEKFAVRWITYVPVFIVLYITGFVIIDALRVAYCTVTHPTAINIKFAFSSLLSDKDMWLASICGLCAFLAYQSMFVLGSSIWPKKSFIKTFLGLIVVNGVCSIYFTTLALALFEPNMNYVPLWLENWLDHFQPTRTMMACAATAVSLIFSSINYVLAYYRYRESEIIQRW